jgi:small subunit ribosomal protein S16
MLAIKFKRVGKKHQASFRIVVGEKRRKIVGRYVDDLGWYNPRTDSFEIDKKKAEHWIAVGAQPTDTVRNLLIKANIIRGKKKPLHLKPKKGGAAEAAEAPKPAPAPAAAPAAADAA